MTQDSGSIARFIDREWITVDQTREIISETQKLIKRARIKKIDESSLNSIKIIINEIINISINAQISAVKPKSEWKKFAKLAKNFVDYANTLDDFRKDGFSSHQIPNYLIIDAKNLIYEVELAFDINKKPNFLPWERAFYPRIMAVFNVIFRIEPVSTASENYEPKLGSTAAFIHSIISNVRQSQKGLCFDERFGGKASVDIMWRLPTPDKLRVDIIDWKRRKPKDEKGQTIWSSRPLWKRHVAEYQERLQTTENNR